MFIIQPEKCLDRRTKHFFRVLTSIRVIQALDCKYKKNRLFGGSLEIRFLYADAMKLLV